MWLKDLWWAVGTAQGNWLWVQGPELKDPMCLTGGLWISSPHMGAIERYGKDHCGSNVVPEVRAEPLEGACMITPRAREA